MVLPRERGAAIVLGHNVWVWNIPVLVTLVGWLTMIKSAVYLVIPRGRLHVMPSGWQAAFGLWASY